MLIVDGVWQKLFTNKYLRGQTLSQVQAKPTYSHFWKGIMGVKEEFFKRAPLIVGDGSTTRFWEDVWLGSMLLAN
jgi:hypothetical protein